MSMEQGEVPGEVEEVPGEVTKAQSLVEVEIMAGEVEEDIMEEKTEAGEGVRGEEEGEIIHPTTHNVVRLWNYISWGYYTPIPLFPFLMLYLCESSVYH